MATPTAWPLLPIDDGCINSKSIWKVRLSCTQRSCYRMTHSVPCQHLMQIPKIIKWKRTHINKKKKAQMPELRSVGQVEMQNVFGLALWYYGCDCGRGIISRHSKKKHILRLTVKSKFRHKCISKKHILPPKNVLQTNTVLSTQSSCDQPVPYCKKNLWQVILAKTPETKLTPILINLWEHGKKKIPSELISLTVIKR